MLKHILEKCNYFDKILNPLHNLEINVIVSQDAKKKILNVFHFDDNMHSTSYENGATQKTIPRAQNMKESNSAHCLILIFQAHQYRIQEFQLYLLTGHCLIKIKRALSKS